MEHLTAALACALLGVAGGLLVPRLVAVVPEPEPDAQAAEEAEQKEPYAAIAATPGLAVRSAVVCAVVAGALGAVVGWHWPLLYLLPWVPLGAALAVIDWRTRRLPTWYLAPAYPVMVVLLLVCAVATRDWDDLRRAGFGWLVMGGFYFLTNLLSPRLVGYGDVRLSGLLGMALGYLGWGQLLLGMYVAFFLFGLPALFLAVVRRDRAMLRMRMPFGPAMLAGAVLGVVVGAPLADWYLRSTGWTA